MKRSQLALAFCVMALCCAGRLAAETIVSTLTSGVLPNTYARIDGAVSHGAEFTTDNSSYDLANVQAVLNVLDAAAINVVLYNDNAGVAGSPILQFGSFTGSGGSQTVTFSPTVPFTLSPDTTYHLVLSSPDSNFNGWDYANTFTVTGPGTAPMQREVTAGGPWVELSDYGLLFSVNGTAVPEPSTLALLGMGALGLAIAFARKRRSVQPD